MGANTNPRSGSTIGAVSAATGCNIETIRYYERIGIVPKPARTNGGRRVYDDHAMRKLRFVRRGRELGFSLGDIRALASLADDGANCGEVRALTLRHLVDVRAKLADLERLERLLSTTANRCRDGKTPKCPILDILA